MELVSSEHSGWLKLKLWSYNIAATNENRVRNCSSRLLNYYRPTGTHLVGLWKVTTGGIQIWSRDLCNETRS